MNLRHGWCVACYAAKRGREAGHRKLPRLPEPVFNPFMECDMAMRRAVEGAVTGSCPGVADDVLKGWLPNLHDHLTETTWDDGKPRKTSTLMILTENGRWKAFLHDREHKRGCWVTAEAWEALLETLERSLADSSTEWRKDTR